MQTTTLVRIVRDPRSGEVHAPNERVVILAIIQNLNRTLLRVRWEGGGDCVIFPDDVDEKSCPLSGSRNRDGSSQGTEYVVYCLVYFALLSLSASNELSLDGALNSQPTG